MANMGAQLIEAGIPDPRPRLSPVMAPLPLRILAQAIVSEGLKNVDHRSAYHRCSCREAFCSPLISPGAWHSEGMATPYGNGKDVIANGS